MSPLTYRPEIDGLRAIAVLGVILYHAGAPFAGGGYVGVDVFFVLSGFLIMSLWLKDTAAGNFRFGAFWVRRARRILPAQLAVIIATLGACYILYFPQDMMLVAKQALSQLVLASNIFFYHQSSEYFGASQI